MLKPHLNEMVSTRLRGAYMEYYKIARPVDNIVAMMKNAATNAEEVLNYQTVNQAPCKKQLSAKRYPIEP